MPAKRRESVVKKHSAKKSAAKKAVTKKSVVKKSSKPLRANRPAKPIRKTPPGHGVAKLETKPGRVAEILRILDETYGNPQCALDHTSPWELLVATILSAQCTDVRVNMVTPALFSAYPTPAEMAAAPIEHLEQLIRTTGFFHNKAKSIQGAGRVITETFSGKVPQTLAELITVPGAARKTANVVLGVSYGLAEGVVVDTHVFRIARRLGLAKTDTAQSVEQELMKVIPRDRWIGFSHQIIHHGRAICEARKPKCHQCPLESLCHAPDKTWRS